MSWSLVLALLFLEFVLGVILSAFLNKVAVWLSGYGFVSQLLANRWALMEVNIVAIFIFPWMLCGGLAFLAIQLQSPLLATATLVIGFSSIVFIPFIYATLLSRLRRLHPLSYKGS